MKISLERWISGGAALAVFLGLAVMMPISQSSAVFAQSATTGSINGTVVDPTGAVIPGAAVTVTDKATGAIVNLTSNAEGRFTAAFLKPDMFQVTATAPGFRPARG